MSDSVEKYATRLRDVLPELKTTYRVKSLSLFGSYARGTERAGSDLDVLVTFDEPPSLFGLIELESYLGDLLGVKVDLVMRDSLKPRIGRRIAQDLMPI